MHTQWIRNEHDDTHSLSFSLPYQPTGRFTTSQIATPGLGQIQNCVSSYWSWLYRTDWNVLRFQTWQTIMVGIFSQWCNEFDGNAAMAVVIIETPLSHNFCGTMVTIGTNWSYEIPVKTKTNTLRCIKVGLNCLFYNRKLVLYSGIAFADTLFNSKFKLKIMKSPESTVGLTKTAIKLIGDRSLSVSWDSEYNYVLLGVKNNIINQWYLL